MRLFSETDFAEFESPGYSKAAFGMTVEDRGGGWSELTSEVRVLAGDARLRKALTRGGQLAAPEISWVHSDYLDAIRRRAEGAPATP